MSRQLRFAAALCCQEAEGDHLPLGIGKAGSGVIVPKTVVSQPIVNMLRFLRAGLPEAAHSFSEDIHLCLSTQFSAVLCHAGRLSLQRKLDALCFQHRIGGFQEREGPPDTEIGHRLIHDLLYLHRRYTEIQRCTEQFLVFIDALASDQGRQYRHPASPVIQLLSILVDHLIESEIVEPLYKLRIGTEKIRLITWKHLFVIRSREL